MDSHVVHKPKENKHRVWVTIFVIFAGIVGFLVYTSFFNLGFKGGISGNVIKNNYNGVIEIDSSLTPPEKLEINGKIEKIELKTGIGYFFIGNEKFDLNRASIVIDNYKGKISFNKNKITKLRGRASRVFVQGIPITSSSDMKIYFDKEFDYSYLKLSNFHLNSLSYKTSGLVKLNRGKVVVNLDDEDFKIEDFQGDLEIRRNNFKIKGEIKKSNLGFINIKAGRREKVDKEVDNKIKGNKSLEE